MVLSSKLWALTLSCVLALSTQNAVARLLGGGESVVELSANVSQRSDLATVLVQALPRVAAAGAAGALTAAPKSGLGTVLGDVATGLGLTWLASILGFGDVAAQALLMGLIAVAVLVAVGLLLRRRTAATSGLIFQAAVPGTGDSQLDPFTPRGYSLNNVGNDASARPWEQDPAMPEPSADPMTSPALGDTPSWGTPDGFDTVGFLKASKANFVSLQAAWDRSDIAALRAMMTDGMLEQIKVQLAEREQTQGETANQTDVVMLEARLLGIEEVGPGYLASVEFSGLIREDASAGPNPFREVWNITRAKSGPGGWLVAGVQALQ
jgi:predicted lipid-binding transport protein (Tim44 family)